ncbi:hypothetical protein [Burkholderia stagnalis]
MMYERPHDCIVRAFVFMARSHHVAGALSHVVRLTNGMHNETSATTVPECDAVRSNLNGHSPVHADRQRN